MRMSAAVSGGMVKVENNEVLVLVETAEYPESIDEMMAWRDAEAAREEPSHKQGHREYVGAQPPLARAMNRLKVKQHRSEQH